MLQLLLNPQVAKRREERKGGRRGTRLLVLAGMHPVYLVGSLL
jgi:hypothetical protein